jgi:tRNA uridine 5-carbamoylmethylation protein Kti12
MMRAYIKQIHSPAVWLLIGPPGCGKSLFRRKLVATYDELNRDPLKVCSTDDLIEERRESLESYHTAFMRLIAPMTDLMRADYLKYVSASCDVIVDRTNITVGTRSKYFDSLKEAKQFKLYKKIGVCWLTEPEDLLIRNRFRSDKYIAENIQEKFYQMFEFPFKEEGFDDIMYVF